jgi:hypothetical protein
MTLTSNDAREHRALRPARDDGSDRRSTPAPKQALTDLMLRAKTHSASSAKYYGLRSEGVVELSVQVVL